LTRRGSPFRGGEPTPLGALLATARDTAAAAGGAHVKPDTWRKVVGARISARTAPGRLRAGVLTVRVATAVWAQELSLLSSDIVARLREAGVPADSLRFRVAPLAAPERKQPRPAPPPPVKLPYELRERLAKIDDPELRAAVTEAAAWSLAANATRRAARAPRSVEPKTDRPDRNVVERPSRGSRKREGSGD